MNTETIYKEIKEYFIIQELVSETVYNKYKEKAWRFICPMLLESILILRKNLDVPFTANTWHNGGIYDERGLRDNVTDILYNKSRKKQLYLSAHVMGKALDFTVSDMTSEEVRMWIVANEHLFPHRIRLEHKLNGTPISWVHLDVQCDLSKPKVYLFNV